MQAFSEQNILKESLSRLNGCEDPRLKQVIGALTRHLYAFVCEIEPTEEELMQGIQFLTAVGQKSDDVRQEFILLSDALGVTILVDGINHRKTKGVTESSVLGPFYRPGAPEYENGVNISLDQKGRPTSVSGTVRDTDGNPITGAKLDVWQTASNALYQVQDPKQPEFNLCGVFTSDEKGRYAFRTDKPVHYQIPDDGPVGQLLSALGRHPYRPAHIHFKVSADGYDPVVTQIFTDDDEYLNSDAVFGVKDSLVVHYDESDDGFSVTYDFWLKPAA